jgi:hypothetical protein
LQLLQALLDLHGKELPASVGLDALYGEWHLLDHLLEKLKCVCGDPSRIEAEHAVAGTVIYGRVLVQTGTNLAHIHLDPVAWDRAVVSMAALPSKACPAAT